MPDIERATQVLGWMSHTELAWLAEQASKRSQVVEIGSYLGRSTRALADNSCGRVYAIDTWRNADVHPYMRVPPFMLGEDWCWNAFLRNVGDLIPDRLEVRRRQSAQAALEFAGEGRTFDLIFIDGAHDYQSVKEDIQAWRPLLKDGGLLCGHDFIAKHMGVVEAVREEVKEFEVMDTIWCAA
jgi:predicted O-methyltransferase YrrM